MPGSASAAAIEALYYLNLSVDVPLLFWALSPLARRRAFSRSVWICVATAVTVTYMALKLAFRREAFLELPVVGLLLAGIIFGLFRTRDREALLFAVVYASFASIIVSTTYKMMDFAFGYNLVWASLVSVSLALAAKAVFARYCRQRVGAFMATAVRWPQALLMLLLWPTTVSILAFNRDEVGPVADFFASPSALVVTLCLLALVAILWVVELAGYSEARLTMERLEWALASQRRMYEQKLAHDEQMRRLYHDFKHVRPLIDAKKAEDFGAAPMLEQLDETLRYHEMQPRTGNTALDACIAQKASHAQGMGVEVHTYMDLHDCDFIRDIDLICVVGNAFDNAIEAAAQVADPKRRVVRAKATVLNGQLVMVVSNWYEGPRKKNEGRYLTTKGDAFAHGYGLEAIERCARRCAGHISVSDIGGAFELCISIPMPSLGQNAPRK